MTSPTPPEAALSLAWLEGEWRVERQIVDHLAQATGTFTGAARFTPARALPWRNAPALAFHEAGTLVLGEYQGRAERSLLFVDRGAEGLSLDFLDGRTFVVITPQSSLRAHHQCKADGYDVSFSILSDECLDERWQVRGPSKRYDAFTRYRRVVVADSSL